MGKLFEETSAKFKSYVMPTYNPQIMFVRGKGAKLWDDDGNEYLDFAAGIAVCSLGHCNDRVTEAEVDAQWDSLIADYESEDAALEILKQGGICVICVYPGHDEGAEELSKLTEMLAELLPQRFNVLRQTFINATPGSPECFIAQKQ